MSKEQRELAWLKWVFFAELSSEERELLEQMTGSEEGQTLEEQALHTKHLLSQVGELKVTAPGNEGMLQRFEDRIRSDAMQRSFVGASCPSASGCYACACWQACSPSWSSTRRMAWRRSCNCGSFSSSVLPGFA